MVLPLYDQFQLKKNEYTYEPLICKFSKWIQNKIKIIKALYSSKRDVQKVFKIYEHIIKENLPPTYKTLNNYLEMAMRTEEVNRITAALQEFKKRSNFFYITTLTYIYK